VGVVANEDVPSFGPALPDPPVFTNLEVLREFLMAKSEFDLGLISTQARWEAHTPFSLHFSVINGENAAYKAPKFSKPHQRARQSMLENIVREHLSRNLSVTVVKKDKEKEKDKEKKSANPFAEPIATPLDHPENQSENGILGKKIKTAEESASTDGVEDGE
jgi:hypothetical protein